MPKYSFTIGAEMSIEGGDLKMKLNLFRGLRAAIKNAGSPLDFNWKQAMERSDCLINAQSLKVKMGAEEFCDINHGEIKYIF